jgi:YggT family protein
VLFLLALLVDAYSLVVLVAVVASWLRVSDDNPIVRIAGRLTEPILGPIRRVVPILGGIDLSAMVLLLGLRVLRGLLIELG